MRSRETGLPAAFNSTSTKGINVKKTAILWRTCAITTVFAILALGTISTATAADSNTDGQPVLTVATIPDFVPFESRDPKTGEYVGFDMDIIREIAKRAGFGIKLKLMDFNGVIPALQAKSVDMAIDAITITDKRAKAVDFSQPYYDSGLKLMVRADDDSIKTVEDLKGKKVSSKIGSTSYDYLTHKVKGIKKIELYPGTVQMYMALMDGIVDASFYDVPNILYFIKVKGHGKVKAVGPVYAGQQYGIAFPKGSDWVEPVNKALTAMKEDGTFTKIYKKWFDAEPPKDLLTTG